MSNKPDPQTSADARAKQGQLKQEEGSVSDTREDTLIGGTGMPGAMNAFMDTKDSGSLIENDKDVIEKRGSDEH